MEKIDFHLFCFDYDETLASEGIVDPRSITALKNLKSTGRKLVLVMGRQTSDLLQIFPDISLCDLVVAENGGALYDPATQQEKLLTSAPPPAFVLTLQKENVPISVGRTIVASHLPFEKTILRVIQELGIEYQIIFNKGSVMMLPSGVNKATGLAAALVQLQVPTRLVIGMGDGENDQAFLELCGMSAAVSGAVESLKAKVDWVASQSNGAGVRELIDRLLAGDLVTQSNR
jgi:hydroxymethylpyrimidine pyrophosphatase-like HAD family hydrolase